MQKVIEATKDFTRGVDHGLEQSDWALAAEAFAIMALRTYKDALLEKALAVSKAMIDFEFELKP